MSPSQLVATPARAVASTLQQRSVQIAAAGGVLAFTAAFSWTLTHTAASFGEQRPSSPAFAARASESSPHPGVTLRPLEPEGSGPSPRSFNPGQQGSAPAVARPESSSTAAPVPARGSQTKFRNSATSATKERGAIPAGQRYGI